MSWILLIAVGGVVVIAGFVLGLLHMIAMLSGWRRLARTFRTDSPADGKEFRAQSFYGLGSSHYIGAVDIYLASGGMYLAVGNRVFKLAHPPLFIPWKQLHEVSRTGTFVRLGVGSPELMQFKIPGAVWDARSAA